LGGLRLLIKSLKKMQMATIQIYKILETGRRQKTNFRLSWRSIFDPKRIVDVIVKLKNYKGVAIFAKACFGHPSPSKRQKLNATANACGGPSRPASLVLYPTRGIKLVYAMTRRDVGMLCIFTTQTALRENAQPYRS
jgi:hypothetical protein